MSPLALALVLSAAIAHAAWNIVAHGVSRAGVPFLWCGAVAGAAIWGAVIPLSGGLGTDDLGGFFAVTIAPVSLIAPLREVSVVLVSLFGVFMLKETRPRSRLAASAVVAGIVLLEV